MREGMGGRHRPRRGYSDTWLTPKWLLDALGHFDTDPACPEKMPWATADTMYSIIDNGLMQPWTGRVWLNPPYGRDTATWLDRMAAHGDGIALIFARTETEAFHRYVWDKADAIFFFYGRLDFLDEEGRSYKGIGRNGNAGAPSCLIAYGDQNTEVLRSLPFPGVLVTAWERASRQVSQKAT